jgi:hypothetical protein
MSARNLRIGSLVCALVATGLLAVPVSLEAAKKTYRLAGPVEGDPNATVSVQVVVKNRKPRKLKNLEYENLDAHCNVDGTTIEPAGELSGNAGRNLAGFQDPQHSLFQWYSFPNDGARQVDARGRVKMKGKKVVGEIDVYDNARCAASTKNRFTATK